MRHSLWFFSAMMSVGLGASVANATFTQDNVPPRTTADLVAICTTQSNDPQAGAAAAYCYGFAEGAVDVVLVAPQSNQPFCLPAPLPKLSQVVGDFVTWANGDTATLQKPAVVGFVGYLVQRFPCPYTSGTASRGKR